MLEEIHCNGWVSEKSFSVRDSLRRNSVGNRQNGGIDFSAREVNRVKQESGTGSRFSPGVQWTYPLCRREPLLGYRCTSRVWSFMQVIDLIVL